MGRFMRCSHCGELLTEKDLYCPNCGRKAVTMPDNSIALQFYWFLLGALLDIFTLLIYVFYRRVNKKNTSAMLLGLITLFVLYFIYEKMF